MAETKVFQSTLGTFTFRRPTFRDWIEFDVLAAQYRRGQVEGLTYGMKAAESLATLNTLVVPEKDQPKPDFGAMEDDLAVWKLFGEVDQWLGSFRPGVGDAAGSAGEGTGAEPGPVGQAVLPTSAN